MTGAGLGQKISTVGSGGSGSGGFKGMYDPSSGNVPNNNASAGDYWISNAIGVIRGVDVGVGTLIIANVNNPGNVAANWTFNS